MSIQKKSLISTLKTAKKANLAKADVAEVRKGDKQVSAMHIQSLAKISPKTLGNMRMLKTVY